MKAEEIEEIEQGEVDFFGPIEKIRKDLVEAAKRLSHREARYIVSTYYKFQGARVAFGNQMGAMKKAGEPSIAIKHFWEQAMRVEKNIILALDAYSKESPLAMWARSNKGIGPILSAGLLAFISIPMCQTVSQIWRFAGLDPTMHWLGVEGAKEAVADVLEKNPNLDEAVFTLAKMIGTRAETLRRNAVTNRDGNLVELTRLRLTAAAAKRPWNDNLKVLAHKIASSFVMTSGCEGAFYGQIYRKRKEYEVTRNESGGNEELAAEVIKKYKKPTVCREKLLKGRLPDGQINKRAMRYAVKLFLSHYWEVGRKLAGLPIVKPFSLENGHAHYIPPPNFP